MNISNTELLTIVESRTAIIFITRMMTDFDRGLGCQMCKGGPFQPFTHFDNLYLSLNVQCT